MGTLSDFGFSEILELRNLRLSHLLSFASFSFTLLIWVKDILVHNWQVGEDRSLERPRKMMVEVGLSAREGGSWKEKLKHLSHMSLLLRVTFSLRLLSSLKRVSSNETTSQLCINPFSCATEKLGGTWLRKSSWNWLYLIPTTVCFQSESLKNFRLSFIYIF